MINLIHGDCLEKMKDIPDGSVDMILCDLPYGITSCKWDVVIPFDKLWEQYERIIKFNGAIALFASGLFVNKLIFSKDNLYKYKWIWLKNTKGNFINAKNRPMTAFEEILVFSKGNATNNCKNKITYNPQGILKTNKEIVSKSFSERKTAIMLGYRPSHKNCVQEFTNYPCDVLRFNNEKNKIHTTQKPVDLLEYLIKTYTNGNELVLDNCMGSGSTGVACLNTGRRFIGIEKDGHYFKVAKERIENNQPPSAV